ncbi:hypothetical protein AAMO2058_000853900 [Amorphochlora amoebiformis]
MECFYASFSPTGSGSFQQVCVNSGVISNMGSAPIELVASSTVAALSSSTNIIFILTCAVLVFWMQAGFAILEAGSVRPKNTNNILFKNLMDCAIGALGFWILGYSFAFGNGRTEAENSGRDNRFIGSGNWALQNFNDDTEYHLFFFQWAFSAAATTIVSGSLAERCRLEAYFIYSVYLSTFVYPVVVHWVWSGTGWLSSTYVDEEGNRYLSKNGMIDFAGSGVVHMVGGFAGLVGTYIMGPRTGFFGHKSNAEATLKGSNELLCSLGVSILWMGWYAFNAGSALGYSGTNSQMNVAGKVAVTTTISAATSSIVTTIYSRVALGYYNLTLCLNGVLAGLVSVTAACGVVEPWAAMMIGIFGSLVFLGASSLIKRYKIDDPLEAFPVHGACGLWGCIAVGIFASSSNIARAYGLDNDAVQTGNQLRNQIIGVVVIMVWVVGTMAPLFLMLKSFGLLRVTPQEEQLGLDAVEHGVQLAHNRAGVDKRAKPVRVQSDSPRHLGNIPHRENGSDLPSPANTRDQAARHGFSVAVKNSYRNPGTNPGTPLGMVKKGYSPNGSRHNSNPGSNAGSHHGSKHDAVMSNSESLQQKPQVNKRGSLRMAGTEMKKLEKIRAVALVEKFRHARAMSREHGDLDINVQPLMVDPSLPKDAMKSPPQT